MAGEPFGDALEAVYRWGDTAETVWDILRWPLGLVLLIVAVTLLFRHAPRRRQPGPSWLAVGAGVTVFVWLAGSGLLALYVAAAANFGDTYGPLTAVMALLLWANITGIALLAGLALAAQLEAVRGGRPDPLLPDSDDDGITDALDEHPGHVEPRVAWPANRGSPGSCGWRSCRRSGGRPARSGTSLSILVRNLRNSAARCRRCRLDDHRPVGGVQRREQAGDAVADVVVGAPLGHARHHRQHRLGPVQRLDLGLLVDPQHDRALGRVEVQPDDVGTFSTNSGSLDSLNVSARCGLSSNARQIRPIVDSTARTASAIDARDQCVAFAGVDSRVATTTSST